MKDFVSGCGWFKRFREDVDVNTAVAPQQPIALFHCRDSDDLPH